MKCTLSICITLLVLFQQQQFVCGQLQCGTVGRVGSTRTGSMQNRAENEFYIDRGNRAECAGMITSISYCFHRPPVNVAIADEYLATVAVYTPASSDDNERMFTVSSSPIVIQKSATEVSIELGSSNFACSELSLPEPVSVAVGDVLGVCLFNPPDSDGVTRYRLDLVSRALSGSEDLVRTDTQPNNPAGCSATEVPSSFDASDPNRITSGRSVHLWANIVPPTDPPTDPPTEVTDPSTDSSPDSTTGTDALFTGDPDSPTTQLGTGGTTAQLVTGDTTALPISGGGGSVTTVAVAVVIVLLVVIVISVILVAAIVLLTKRRKNVKKSYTMNTNNSVGEQMIDVKLNEAYGTRNKVTHDTTTEAVYDVINETDQKQPEEPIPTDTNAAYHSHSVNNTTTETPEYYDVLANPYEAVPVGEVDMPMEENTAYASNALDNNQETTDYDYVLRQ